jgi:hypothetical protein
MKKINISWLAVLALVVSLVVISGCASKNTVAEKIESPPVPIKTIAILPIQTPQVFTLEKSENALILFGIIGISIHQASVAAKNDGFGKKMREYSVPLGSNLMRSLEQGLLAQNYEVVVLRDQDMGLADPSDFDADAIVHVIIKSAGVSSPHRSLSYKPQLNVDVNVISTKDQNKIDDWSVDYGADASKLDYGNIPADPKFAWASYDLLMQKIPDVVEGLQLGASQLGGHIAKTLRDRKL